MKKIVFVPSVNSFSAMLCSVQLAMQKTNEGNGESGFVGLPYADDEMNTLFNYLGEYDKNIELMRCMPKFADVTVYVDTSKRELRFADMCLWYKMSNKTGGQHKLTNVILYDYDTPVGPSAYTPDVFATYVKEIMSIHRKDLNGTNVSIYTRRCHVAPENVPAHIIREISEHADNLNIRPVYCIGGLSWPHILDMRNRLYTNNIAVAHMIGDDNKVVVG